MCFSYIPSKKEQITFLTLFSSFLNFFDTNSTTQHFLKFECTFCCFLHNTFSAITLLFILYSQLNIPRESKNFLSFIRILDSFESMKDEVMLIEVERGFFWLRNYSKSIPPDLDGSLFLLI
jgi:hypothetical protein